MSSIHTAATTSPLRESGRLLRAPVAEDGPAVHNLIARCRPLDENSRYCNLLQCTHFSTTSAAAFDVESLVGFASGYRIPQRPDSLFVWQVAIADQARGQGLAQQLLLAVLQRPSNQDLHFIETSINPGNQASWTLFGKLAKQLDAQCSEQLLFDKERHFQGGHEDEILLRIGPFQLNR